MSFTVGGETEYYQPKDPPTPECRWCDGTKMVEVGSVIDVLGKQHDLLDIYGGEPGAYSIQCPRCREHPGVEPIPEREER
jgi:hypothetical protein